MRVHMMQIATDHGRSFDDRVAEILSRITRLRGVDLVTLPELWPTGYFAFDDYAATAQPLDGPLCHRLAEAARTARVHLHAGSMVERDEDGRLYNTSLLFTPDGRLAHTYRKYHLFGHQSRESQLLTPGSTVDVVDTAFGGVGLSTCYDLRFPELYRLQVDRGARVLLVAAAWPMARLAHWRLFTQVRAVENQSFLIATNAAGVDGDVTLAGHSVVVDPWGTVLAEAGADEQTLEVSLDPAEADRFRTGFPALADRRLTTSHGITSDVTPC